jgi:hypothetical protein
MENASRDRIQSLAVYESIKKWQKTAQGFGKIVVLTIRPGLHMGAFVSGNVKGKAKGKV